MKKNFNIILVGVGGQGLITLLSLINEAAFQEGLDVKSSELHGLSQRGGSVETHIRFGKKVYSPLISRGRADLIIALEETEGLRALPKANKEAKFLINKYYLAFQGAMKEEEVVGNLRKAAGDNLHLVAASDTCRIKLQNDVVAGIYLLGYAVSKKLIPFKEESVIKAIEKIVPAKYLELNIKAFKLAND